jgi:hypothetical protein
MKVRFKIQLLNKMGTEQTFKSKPDYVDLVNLIRSIQRAEGNLDCYRRDRQQCDRMNCVWRDYCLETPSPGGESQEHKIAANPMQEQESLP